MSLCKGSSRPTLQVSLEFRCAYSIAKRNGGFDLPRTTFRGVGNLAAIVLSEPRRQIVGQPNVVAQRTGDRFENVNVVKTLHRPPLLAGLPSRSPDIAVIWPASALRASARQPSPPLRSGASKDESWRRLVPTQSLSIARIPLRALDCETQWRF